MGWEKIVWDNGHGERQGGLYKVVSGTSLLARRILGDGVWMDLAVYGRYAAIEYATHDVIYIQDDDALTPALAVSAHYEPGRLVANMPRSRWEGYPDSALVGWGAIFDRDLPKEAFNALAKHLYANREDSEGDPWLNPAFVDHFHVTCDVVFSSLTPRTVVDYPFEHLPWAEGPDRMFTSRPTHNDERQRMLELCREIRGQDDDRRDW